MFWLSLTTFFIIAKIWGHLSFSWWWIILMLFFDTLQFLLQEGRVFYYKTKDTDEEI